MDAAIELERNLFRGDVRVDPDTGDTNTRWGVIALGRDLANPPSSYAGLVRGKLWAKELDDNRSTVWLASILYHEQYHIDHGQGGVLFRWQVGRAEIGAWTAQRAFLSGITRAGVTRRRAGALDDLSEAASDQIRSYGG